MSVAIAAAPPFMKNGYVVSCDDTRECVVIDPGDEVDDLLEIVRSERLRAKMILLTHAHLDHVTGVGRAKAALAVPVWLHPADLFLYDDVVEQGRMFGLHVDPQPPIDHFFTPGTPLPFGRLIRRRARDAWALPRRRLPGDWTRERPEPRSLRWRHAVCRLDRAHRFAGWRF